MIWLEIVTYTLVGITILGVLVQGLLALIESVIDK